MLVEQQLVNRASEFEGRAFVRSMTGGVPAPTLDSLLAFHHQAAQAGDEAAREWARRQLEAMRSRTFSADDQRRIDLACDRPDRLNPRLVSRYVEAMGDRPAEEREQFVAEALESRDASACAAAFVLAREAPEGVAARWVRSVLEHLSVFPDAAISAVRCWEADARGADAEAARAAAEYAAVLAETEARLPGLEAPSEAKLERLGRIQSRPVAQPDEPIGLNLQRRGLQRDEESLSPFDGDADAVA